MLAGVGVCCLGLACVGWGDVSWLGLTCVFQINVCLKGSLRHALAATIASELRVFVYEILVLQLIVSLES